MTYSRIERLLLISGLLLIAIYAAAQIHKAIFTRAELWRFRERQAQRVGATASSIADSPLQIDFTGWSAKRIAAFERGNPPLAVLRISKVHLEAPVLEGTDELVLNQGVGHIAGTMAPGERGNIGIAGHRDGFFRALKDVNVGDRIELETLRGTDAYVVDRIVVVSPNEVSVLQPRQQPSVTLVTCYPFYFVGSAPQRYIVQASAPDSSLPSLQAKKGALLEPAKADFPQRPDASVSK